jgi:hypothetical protein
MTGRRWLVTVAIFAVVALVVSGSRSDDNRTGHDTFTGTRMHFDSVLTALDARLARLDPGTPDSADDTNPMLAIDRLRERTRQIATTLSAFEDAPEPERLGALAGLRASVADLEYRVDLAELANANGVVVTDSLIDAWLREADERLTSAEHMIVDSATATGYLEPIRDARDECGRLEARFASIREQFADEIAPRHSLGHELAEVRRQVRATVRSMPSGPAHANTIAAGR